MIRKRVYKRRKKKVKFYKFAGLKAQGKKELRYIKECIRYKREMPTKPKRIETPFGFYTPDFEQTTRFIEIKSLHTFKVSMGEESYKGLGETSNKQFEKIKWVSQNVKPIEIIIYLSPREKKITFSELETKTLTITVKGGYTLKRIKKSVL